MIASVAFFGEQISAGLKRAKGSRRRPGIDCPAKSFTEGGENLRAVCFTFFVEYAEQNCFQEGKVQSGRPWQPALDRLAQLLLHTTTSTTLCRRMSRLLGGRFDDRKGIVKQILGRRSGLTCAPRADDRKKVSLQDWFSLIPEEVVSRCLSAPDSTREWAPTIVTAEIPHDYTAAVQ